MLSLTPVILMYVLRQLMVEFYLLTLSVTKKNKNPTLVRIELTTSARAGVQVTY